MTIYLNTDFGIPGQFCKTKNLLVVRSVISNSRDHFDKMGDLTTNLELGKSIDTGTMASNAYNKLGNSNTTSTTFELLESTDTSAVAS